MTEDRLTRIEKIVESNAKSIEALSDAVAQDRKERAQERKEWAQDRRRIFEWMARLSAAQRDFYEVQADYIRHIEEIEDRLAQILDRLTPQNEDQP
ncbi:MULTISPECIES: hypothetical protein [Cyanophyceae]|uniref:Uncharacterized protein n=1 Tax=Crocosphaera subtropica (strain ATCC 51142 / BH68) TaxID=43989 RepID=B1WYI0_CROS5|nr:MULTISPECIES: hypothetical protein [Cyanophyceae]ACB49410.1 unknown [Crocosphaera subtropica ATCC 51142]